MSVPGFLLLNDSQPGRLISPYANGNTALGADAHNFEPNGWWVADHLRLNITGTADRIVTGFLRQAELQGGGSHPKASKLIYNDESLTQLVIRFAHENVLSTSSNRLLCPKNVDLLFGPGDTIRYYHDDVQSLARLCVVSRGPVIPRTLNFTADDISSTEIGLPATGFRLGKMLLLNVDGAYNLVGMEAGYGQSLIVTGSTQISDAWLGHRKRKTLVNVSSDSITIVHESVTETEARNRFITAGGVSVVVTENESVEVEYDDIVNRWRVLYRSP